jgi:hypothetical protein
MYTTAVDQLLAYADGKPTGVMNPEVLERGAKPV